MFSLVFLLNEIFTRLSEVGIIRPILKMETLRLRGRLVHIVTQLVTNRAEV